MAVSRARGSCNHVTGVDVIFLLNDSASAVLIMHSQHLLDYYLESLDSVLPAYMSSLVSLVWGGRNPVLPSQIV